ncbi:response regulator [Phenylobacterium sp.]|uniref:response regulator transcription factor n=1 Tax=Phenylobacterium sp. TaxID=1871053 RepID=UPI00286B01A7|nr:response regulator [Phenylobacterium sp.]
MISPRPPPSTVIVVDDDDGLRRALRYALEIEGFNVVTCASAESLLKLALPRTSACLVVDQALPGLSGIDALEALRAQQMDLPAIVITSSPDARLRDRTQLANAVLIEKPLLNDRLTRAIRALL